MMMMTICFNEATRLLESSRSRLTLRPRQRHDCHDCVDDDYGGRHHHQGGRHHHQEGRHQHQGGRHQHQGGAVRERSNNTKWQKITRKDDDDDEEDKYKDNTTNGRTARKKTLLEK